MSWDDKPTANQLDAIRRFLGFHTTMPRKKVSAAIEYLEEHATRREASEELGRLRSMFIDRKLNRDNCFDSEIWKDFKFEEDDYPTEKQTSLIYAIFRRYMPIGRAMMASMWLGQNATREEVSKEIERVKKLEEKYTLDEEECFISDVWKKYKK